MDYDSLVDSILVLCSENQKFSAFRSTWGIKKIWNGIKVTSLTNHRYDENLLWLFLMTVVLFMRRFQICKFIFSLKFIGNSRTSTHSAWPLVHVYSSKSQECPDTCSQLRSYKVILWLLFQFILLTSGLSVVSLVPCFSFCIFEHFVGDFEV